jgi:hypothetical protein
MNSQFEDAIFQAIGAEAGASDVLLRFEKENRPILDVVSGAEINFCVQPFSNFFKGERAADEACHFRRAPRQAADPRATIDENRDAEIARNSGPCGI